MSTSKLKIRLVHSPLSWLFVLLALVSLLALGGPSEKSLGSNVRVVYLHGAWVWTSLAAFIAAGILGLVALFTRRGDFHVWSRALGRTGLLFWISYLPMSIWAMQANWNGLYLAEPRWRLAWIFAVTGLLLQLGLALIDKPALTSFANLVFFAVLLLSLTSTRQVLHPRSPILQSGSILIEGYFAALLGLTLLLAWQIARMWLHLDALSVQLRHGTPPQA